MFLNTSASGFECLQENGHGRQEIRRYWVMGNNEHLIGAENWAKLRALRMRCGVTGALKINCIGFWMWDSEKTNLGPLRAIVRKTLQ